jgi:hypothetical protein
MHTRIAVKPTGAPRYTRYEVLGFGVTNGAQPSASIGWAPTITDSVPDRKLSSTAADRMSMR